jgi:predicted dehydrogenase
VGIPLNVGMVGVGKISEQYLANFPTFPGLRLVAVADLNHERASQVAEEYGVRVLTVEELLTDPEVDAVLNLTIPAAHVEISTRALRAGKHVFTEKPLGLTPAEAEPMVELAEELGLRLGGAPDTVLGTGIQTARQVLDSGLIGEPIAAQVQWTAPGHERWHPAPEFYYQPGGGPLLDMGPYYLSALVHFFGSVTRVTGIATRSARARTIESGPRAGTPLPVSVDTHVSALLEHASGVTSTVTMSFEVWKSRASNFEVYGTEGTISVPDPNTFSAAVEVAIRDQDWERVPDSAGYIDTGRGIGLAEMADAIQDNRPHRASGRLALHVLEIMDAILRSSREKAVIQIDSAAERPEIVPLQTTTGATPTLAGRGA